MRRKIRRYNVLTATAAVIFLVGAMLQLQPMFWGMQMTFLMSAADPVRVINALPIFLAGMLSAHLIWATGYQLLSRYCLGRGIIL